MNKYPPTLRLIDEALASLDTTARELHSLSQREDLSETERESIKELIQGIGKIEEQLQPILKRLTEIDQG